MGLLSQGGADCAERGGERSVFVRQGGFAGVGAGFSQDGPGVGLRGTGMAGRGGPRGVGFVRQCGLAGVGA